MKQESKGVTPGSELGTEVIGPPRFKETYETFLEAFSDYFVRLDMNEEKLLRMIRRRDVDLGRSIGLFEGRRMVGFVLNGLREKDRSLIGYDAGTALRPQYRGKGLARRLLEDNLELLRAQGVEEYVLEVITENDPAIGLYESFGFATVRRLRCLKLEDPARIDSEKPVDMVRLRECALSSAPWPILRPQRFYDPSWQNDMEARAASPRGGTTGTEDLVLVLAEECSSQELLGFVLCDADGGEILDFGLAHAEAGRGTEEEVLATLLLDLRRRQVSSGREEPLKILNVGADSQRALELLSNFGFESYVDQFEMRRAL